LNIATTKKINLIPIYNVKWESVYICIIYRREGVGVSDSGVVLGGVQGVVPVHPRLAQVL
jgi:hypothetical protein